MADAVLKEPRKSHHPASGGHNWDRWMRGKKIGKVGRGGLMTWWKFGWVDECTVKWWMSKQMDGRMNGRMDVQMERWINRWADEWIDGCSLIDSIRVPRNGNLWKHQFWRNWEGQFICPPRDRACPKAPWWSTSMMFMCPQCTDLSSIHVCKKIVSNHIWRKLLSFLSVSLKKCVSKGVDESGNLSLASNVKLFLLKNRATRTLVLQWFSILSKCWSGENKEVEMDNILSLIFYISMFSV